jgi:hypothetical protein
MADLRILLEVDRKDAPYGRLVQFAERLKVILDRPKVQADAYLRQALDDFLGAIYALTLSNCLDFTDRPPGTSPEPDKVQIRAEQVAKGLLRLDGKWMAGFHFNSALFRISAVYHRVLRVLTNEHAREVNVGKVREKLQTASPYTTWTGHPWSFTNLGDVHTEVNKLKHDSGGLGAGRDAKMAQALDAVDELLVVLEACPDIR